VAIYNATLKRWDEEFLFASADGELWLPVNRPLVEGEEDEFLSLMDGQNGLRPMRWTRSFLAGCGARDDAEIVFH
jgi:hypothetical protein